MLLEVVTSVPSPSPEGLDEPEGPGCGEAIALVPGDMPEGLRTGISVGVEESTLTWQVEGPSTLPPFPCTELGE